MNVWCAVRTGMALAATVCAYAASNPGWTLVRSPHFEVYSQSGADGGRAALAWFEQLRSFFLQSGLAAGELSPDARPPLRVIGFRSVSEYEAYRLRAVSDAYYVGTETRDYIVMPKLGPEEFELAAHEYSHFVLHAAGLHMPPWLGEGLAEFFSAVRIGSRGCEMGGARPARLQSLQREQWMPLRELTDSPADAPFRSRREAADLFYSETWALTHMLLLSDEYAPKFPTLLSRISGSAMSSQVLVAVYGKSLDAITVDLRSWVAGQSFAPVLLPGIILSGVSSEVIALSDFQSRALMGELLTAAGQLERAEAIYRDLEKESPHNAEVSAALGAIALRKGDSSKAREQFKRAIDEGISDAGVCYRYALIAEDAGLPASAVRAALNRAVELKPDFDDARYKLALLESNAGEYEAALKELRAMRTVAAARAYNYWTAVSNALSELGQRDEAKRAAQKAMEHASNDDERGRARQLAYIAQTDLTVQFARSSDGQLQLVTARKPHGTANWNPFIEPSDRILRAEGELRSVECGGGKITGFSVNTGGGLLMLSIPDPMHVLIRNGPTEFICGPQQPRVVHVEYAASSARNAKPDGVLRGIEFR